MLGRGWTFPASAVFASILLAGACPAPATAQSEARENAKDLRCVAGVEATVSREVNRAGGLYKAMEHRSGRDAEARRLRLLRQMDQVTRDGLIRVEQQCGLDFDDPAVKGLLGLAQHTDRSNQTKLREIIARIGWPVIGRYGADADQAAFLIVQHADNDPALQRAILARFEPLLARGDIAGENYALLTDRVLEAEGKLQRFGTQGDCDGPEWRADPIEAPSLVDQRRQALGLPPLVDYARRASQLCAP